MKLFIYFLAGVVISTAYELPNLLEILVAANNRFTYKLFDEVTKSHPGKSVVMSGFSAMSPLAQLGLASVGHCHDETLNSIYMPNDNLTVKIFTYANRILPSMRGVDLKIASGIFISNGYELDDKYKAISEAVFHSNISSIDFSRSKVAAHIMNTWAEQHTNGKIKDLLSPNEVDASTSAVLLNAIYFKGNWKQKFDPHLTLYRNFYITPHQSIKVPTMFRSGKYAFQDRLDLDAKILQIPYEGEDMDFLVVLPNHIAGLPALEQKLKDPHVLRDITSNLIEAEVDVYLPKFKIETKIDLKEALWKIGVTKIFSDSGIVKFFKYRNRLTIGSAKQKAYLEVNEEGAQAAVINDIIAAGVMPSFIPMKQTFNADHPFLFFLRDKDIIVFAGTFYG